MVLYSKYINLKIKVDCHFFYETKLFRIESYLDQGITTVEGAASFVRGKGRRTKRIYLCTGFAGYSR